MRVISIVLGCLWLSLLCGAGDAELTSGAHAIDGDKGDTIEDVLKRVAGVFKEGSSPKPYDTSKLNKTVIITGCNHGFINHLHNFKCFMDRLDMKFLVVALDRKTHDYLKNTTMESIYMDTESTAGISGESATFRSAQFNLITARKKEAVHDVLELGYDVLFSDTDVALVRDPFSYLLWDHVDYVHSLNHICEKQDHWTFWGSMREEGNTGFYYVKSNRRTIRLWKTAYEAVPHHPGLDDQAVFWKVIRESTEPPIVPIGTCKHYDDAAEKEYDNRKEHNLGNGSDLLPLVTCVLDPCVFSAGMLSRAWVPEFTYEMLLENVALRNETICAVHANYLSGNAPKMQRMQEYGFWLASKEGDTVRDENGRNRHKDHHHKHSHDTAAQAWGGECLDYVFHTESELAEHSERRHLRGKNHRVDY
jgi:hypothetical protein